MATSRKNASRDVLSGEPSRRPPTRQEEVLFVAKAVQQIADALLCARTSKQVDLLRAMLDVVERIVKDLERAANGAGSNGGDEEN